MLLENPNSYQINRNNFSAEENLCFQIINKSNCNILEFGCNAGKLSNELKKQKSAFVVGVDFDHRIAEIAKSNMDKFIQGNIEDDAILNECYQQGKFDYVLLLHVIEHLADPWRFLKKIINLLHNNSKIICATPNIANWNSRALLFFKGRWDYQDIGVMDITHLRFFTENSLIAAFKQANFQVEKILYLHPSIPIIDNCRFLIKYRNSFIGLTKKILPPTLWASTLMAIAKLDSQ